MSRQERDRLIEQLAAARSETLDVLKDADLNVIAHPGSRWQVRDVLGHIAAWDYEAAESLRAYMAGREHYIEADMQTFNEWAYHQRKSLSNEDIVADLESAHEAFKSALLDVPPDKLGGRMAFAWGTPWRDWALPGWRISCRCGMWPETAW